MGLLDQFGQTWTASRARHRYSGRSPGDRATPRFPLEPPSLARATPEGRATAAQEGGASLWWARACAFLDRWAPWMLKYDPEPKLPLQTNSPQRITRVSSPSAEGSPHAPPPRAVSVGRHDTAAGTGVRSAQLIQVGNPGARPAKFSEPTSGKPVERSEPVATKRQRQVTLPAAARPRYRHRIVGDLDTLLFDGDPTNAEGRAGRRANSRPATLRAGDRGGRKASTDGSQPDGASRGETGQDGAKDGIGQSGTGR